MRDDLPLDAQMRSQFGHELARAAPCREDERVAAVAIPGGADAHALRPAGPFLRRFAIAELGVSGARALASTPGTSSPVAGPIMRPPAWRKSDACARSSSSRHAAKARSSSGT